MEQKTTTGRLLRPGSSPKEQTPAAPSDLAQLKLRDRQQTSTERTSTERGPERPVREKQREEGARIAPGRITGRPGEQRISNRSARSQEAREQRAQRRQREREAKAKEQQRQNEREQSKLKEDLDNTVDEQSASTRTSQRKAQTGDRVSGAEVTTGLPLEGLESEAGLNGIMSPDLAAAPDTASTVGTELDTEAILELSKSTSRFADRTKFSQSDLVQTIFYFFANSTRPERPEEEDDDRILSEINRLSPSEITPEKILELFMLGAISQEALKRIEEKVLELGGKAPATKEKIGAIAQKIIKLWKQADSLASDA